MTKDYEAKRVELLDAFMETNPSIEQRGAMLAFLSNAEAEIERLRAIPPCSSCSYLTHKDRVMDVMAGKVHDCLVCPIRPEGVKATQHCSGGDARENKARHIERIIAEAESQVAQEGDVV